MIWVLVIMIAGYDGGTAISQVTFFKQSVCEEAAQAVMRDLIGGGSDLRARHAVCIATDRANP